MIILRMFHEDGEPTEEILVNPDHILYVKGHKNNSTKVVFSVHNRSPIVVNESSKTIKDRIIMFRQECVGMYIREIPEWVSAR